MSASVHGDEHETRAQQPHEVVHGIPLSSHLQVLFEQSVAEIVHHAIAASPNTCPTATCKTFTIPNAAGPSCRQQAVPESTGAGICLLYTSPSPRD